MQWQRRKGDQKRVAEKRSEEVHVEEERVKKINEVYFTLCFCWRIFVKLDG